MNKPFFLSVCSGAGGSSLGALSAGCNTLGIEIDPQIAELYRTNVGEVLVQDVTTLDPYKVEVPMIGDRTRTGQLFIVQVSPPCQDYSVANIGKKNSTRADLLRATFDHYEVWQPDIVILENVRAYRYSQVYADFEAYIRSLGYNGLPLLLNAADFGVPQSRERFFSIFTYQGLPLPTITIHTSHRWVGWYKALADMIPDLEPSTLTKVQLLNIAPYGWQTQLVERVGGYDNRKKVRLSHQPVWTIKAGLGTDGKGCDRSSFIDAVLSQADVRRLNTKALARLQSFPDWYQWSGKNSVDIRGIGNAVPPLMMQRILENVLERVR